MLSNENTTNLYCLYQRVKQFTGVPVWFIMISPVLFRAGLGVSWNYVIFMISGFLVLSTIFYYQTSVLEKAVTIEFDLEELDNQIHDFKILKKIGLYFGIAFGMTLLIWLYIDTPAKLTDQYFAGGLILTVFVCVVMAYRRGQLITRELKSVCKEIEQLMNT